MPASNPENREPSEKARRINPHKMFVGNFVPVWLMARPEISSGAKLMYALIARHAGRNGDCFPFQATLAGEMAISERSAGKFLRELRKAKLIEIERRGLTMSNRYHFLEHEWFDCFLKGNVAQNGSSEDSLLRVAGPDRQNRVCPIIEEENQLKEHLSISSRKRGKKSFSTESPKQANSKPDKAPPNKSKPTNSRDPVWFNPNLKPPNSLQLQKFSRNFWCVFLMRQMGIWELTVQDANYFMRRIKNGDFSISHMLYVILCMPGKKGKWKTGFKGLIGYLAEINSGPEGSEAMKHHMEPKLDGVLRTDIDIERETRLEWIRTMFSDLRLKEIPKWKDMEAKYNEITELWWNHIEGVHDMFEGHPELFHRNFPSRNLTRTTEAN